MAKKALANAVAVGGSSIPAPRAAKPSAKKTKSVTADVVDAVEEPLKTMAASVGLPAEDAQQQIAKIAYGYWAERGFQGGSQAEDWLRAEDEFHGRAR